MNGRKKIHQNKFLVMPYTILTIMTHLT